MDIKRLVITLCLVLDLNSIIVFAARDPCFDLDKNCYLTQSTKTCIAKKQRIDNHLGAVCCCPCSPDLCALDGVHCHKCLSEDSSTPALEELKIIAQPVAKEPIVEKPELKVSDTEEPGVDEGAVVTPDIKESDFDNSTMEEPAVTPTPDTGETDAADLDAGKIEEEIRPTTEPPVVSEAPTKPATKESFGYKDTVIVILIIVIVVLVFILVLICIKPKLRDQIIDKLSCCKSSPVPEPVDEEEAFVDNEKDIEDLL